MRTSLPLAAMLTIFGLSCPPVAAAKDRGEPKTPAAAAPAAAKKKYRYNPWKDDPNYKFYLSGKIQLAPNLLAAAKDHREVYIELYTAEAAGGAPYAWTKYTLVAAPTADLLEFKITEKNIHFTSLYPDRTLPTPTLKVRLTKYGLMGSESPGDLIGVLQGLKTGDDDLTVVVTQSAMPVMAH